MLHIVYAALSVFAFAVLWIMGRERRRLAVAVHTLSRPSSAVGEAERVLSRRYARGVVSADEFEKMMAILHG